MLKGQGRIATVLGQAAESQGVRFSFQGIDLAEDSLEQLAAVERRPGETLVWVMAFDLKFYSDDEDLAGGPRQQLMQVTAGLVTRDSSACHL